MRTGPNPCFQLAPVGLTILFIFSCQIPNFFSSHVELFGETSQLFMHKLQINLCVRKGIIQQIFKNQIYAFTNTNLLVIYALKVEKFLQTIQRES